MNSRLINKTLLETHLSTKIVFLGHIIRCAFFCLGFFMLYRPLGTTDLNVSVICLGTMTFGQQNTEAEAHAQLDMAFERGINFIDTAEMYPVPGKRETQGRTEEYIGSWLKQSGKRDQVILASKVTGRSPNMDWIRGSDNCLSKKNITEAIEGNLKRLGVDCIDLYQLHWPDRAANFFSIRNYPCTPDLPNTTPIEESLEALSSLVKQGKIKHIGLSNETPWGTLEFLRIAREKGLPIVQSVQNPYNLLNRSYEIGMAEVSLRENCGLLAYSPLAFGVLSGKYTHGNRPKGTRLELFGEHFKRYLRGNCGMATESYVKLAKKYDINPAQMALAFVNTRPFVTSNIIGATSLEQLQQNIDSIDLTLPEGLLKDLENVHERYPNPGP